MDLTRHACGVAVVLSVGAYHALRARAEHAGLQPAVDDAEQDLAAGKWVDGERVANRIRRWAGARS